MGFESNVYHVEILCDKCNKPATTENKVASLTHRSRDYGKHQINIHKLCFDKIAEKPK